MRVPEPLRTPLAALGVVAVGAALYVPTTLERRAAVARLDEDRAALAALGDPDPEAAQQRRDELHDTWTLGARKVVDGPRPQGALGALAEAAESVRVVDYSSASGAPVDAPHGAKALPVDATLIARFDQNYHIVRRLEESQRLIRIDEMVMTDLGVDAVPGFRHEDDPAPEGGPDGAEGVQPAASTVETRLKLSAFFIEGQP